MTWMLDLYREIGRPTVVVVQELLNEHSISVSSKIIGISPHTLKKYAVEKGLSWSHYRQSGERAPRQEGVEHKNSRMLEHDGKRMWLRAWARHTGIPHTTILTRLKRGWSVSDALSTMPSQNRFKVGVNYGKVNNR